MKATQQLKDEHEGILLMLKIMNRMMTNFQKNDDLNVDHFAKVIDFIRIFADKCHHGKEEDILFPEMQKHGIPKEGGPIAVMLHEHEQGRGYIKGLNKAFEEFRNGNHGAATAMILNSRNYIDLLRGHIDKENNILFMMADKVISAQEQELIFDAFEKMEVEKIGAGKHEEYHRLLHEFSEIYLK